MLPRLSFQAPEARARFFHNVAVFYGNPGPAADLARARRAFGLALEHFSDHEESGWHARVLHNFATALSNLGSTPTELEESIALFERALQWRTAERAIARGVTLHNMGIARRRLSELDPDRARAHLESSASALSEAASLRESLGLPAGHALSLFHLGLTLERLARAEDPASIEKAVETLRCAADLFEELGKGESAQVARSRAESLDREDAGT